jgi:hypothetical protein
MKGTTIKWPRPSKRSPASLIRLAAQAYGFSTLTQGGSRRYRLSSSHNQVHSYAVIKGCLRAVGHSPQDTMRLCGL